VFNENPRLDGGLLLQMREIHQRSRGTYGAPCIHAELVEPGVRVDRKRIAHLMREAGLAGISRRKGASHYPPRPAVPPGTGPGQLPVHGRCSRSPLPGGHRAPRGALGPSGDETTPPPACRSSSLEAEGSLTRGTPRRVESNPDNDEIGRHCQMAQVWL